MVPRGVSAGDVNMSSELRVIEHQDDVEKDITFDDCKDSFEDKGKTKNKSRKRKLSTMMDEDCDQLSKKDNKRVVLSIMKPSYVLRTGLNSRNLRSVNRKRLCYLLRRLVRQRNWVDASGVLSVLLKGTCKEKSPLGNRLKYTVSMDLVKHIERGRINPIRIKNTFDIWMKRIASLKDSSLEDKCLVHLEFILFCLTRGDIDDAHQAVNSLLQEGQFGSHPMVNMVVGLTFYQRWLSTVPTEMRWKDLDQSQSPTASDFSGERSNRLAENSEAHDTIYSNEADTHIAYDSETSVMNGKRISATNGSDQQREIHVKVEDDMQEEAFINRPSQYFSVYSSENEASFSHDDGSVNYASILPTLEGLDSWLLPIKLPNYLEGDYEYFVRQHMKLLNDDYKNAIKYLNLALSSTPSMSAALLPLIQLLLIGGHVDEALNLLEKFCNDSETTLPSRLKATLVQHLDRNNYATISTCFEDILKKDPTCCHSVARLIGMHQNGDYSPESLLEMIALHLEATFANENIWKEFALCFLKLSRYEEDQLSVCLYGNGSERNQYFSLCYNRPPSIMTDGKAGISWQFRCKWWLSRHFSNKVLTSDMATGDLQLLTYKAATACHMYGRECVYFVKAYTHFEKEGRKDLLLILQKHIHNSMNLYLFFQQRSH